MGLGRENRGTGYVVRLRKGREERTGEETAGCEGDCGREQRQELGHGGTTRASRRDAALRLCSVYDRRRYRSRLKTLSVTCPHC